jgi:hypothetical protein
MKDVHPSLKGKVNKSSNTPPPSPSQETLHYYIITLLFSSLAPNWGLLETDYIKYITLTYVIYLA